MNTARMCRWAVCGLLLGIGLAPTRLHAQQTAKPVLHGKHWVAITGKPLAATAGAMMFQKGGNAVDSACAMLAATSTMWDVLSWGGETQALIYDPRARKVVGINALGVAPTGATVEFFQKKNMKYPPEFGPLAAVTPGTPGGLMVMLSEYGTLSLKEVLGPAIQMADEGYPIEAQTANSIEKNKDKLKQWRYSREVMLPHAGQAREAPHPGEVFRQKDLAATLKKLVEAEQKALAAGKNRKQAIQAAYDRFYRGDIARELVRGVQEEGGLITLEDLARWKVHIEEPVKTTYKGVEVYKLTTWVQGPVLLQALNILETQDLKSMGYNSARYIHALYQAMNLAFADRDFYYGDPYFPPAEPVRGLLSKEYAKARAKLINWEKNDPNIKPGDPYAFQGESNPYVKLLEQWPPAPAPGANPNAPQPFTQPPGAPQPATPPTGAPQPGSQQASLEDFERAFFAGTTSIQAADEKGWVVSVTPSGGWVPAVIAGRTGVGLSQRMQSFVMDAAESPFNVLEPGKRPRATLTPSLALKDGKPYLSFAVQGGDSQDQNLLQFFLNVVEFGMTVQEASEAANINSFQMRTSFGDHAAKPGRVLLHQDVPPWVRSELKRMGYEMSFEPRTSGPINAIYFDHKNGTFWGGSSHHGEDYGIAW
ncbi:gamma-glutamyltransferase family protein [Hyalangium rubrum]|uniref:Gamma-glutamyltransferase n=1 Tax=Hyalangium rubrum TaxID=3103134 RepID=A0ABU5GWQ8_9BACT|nr:gamma-glutamyltransferase [Hyalangium sp. s54d21]MDY7224938.1 gamma-glutamyltransferase [Hyalangium sp. s54d21]